MIRNLLKLFSLVFIIGAFLVAGFAVKTHAQQTSKSSSTLVTNPTCITINKDLAVGSTDSSTSGQTSALQKFLVAQGHLIVPSGARLGSFGPLTKSAVTAFQATNGISSTGRVGPLTRAKIASLSCHTTNSNSPTISWLSPSFGPVNSAVSIRGSNFTSTGNKIKFGNNPHDNLTNISSADGHTLVFNVPASSDLACFHTRPACTTPSIATAPGQYSVSVINANGDSNSVIFTVSSTLSSTSTAGPYIGSVNPSSGPVGTRVTITGRDFDPSGNSVLFNGRQAASGLTSEVHGTSLTFTVPSYLSIPCSLNSFCLLNNQGNPTITPNVDSLTYSVTVKTSKGTSNPLRFTVTSPGGEHTTGTPTTNVPNIISISPTSGPIWSQVTLTGQNFAPIGNIVHFGDTTVSVDSTGGNTLIFNAPGVPTSCPNSIPPSCSYPTGINKVYVEVTSNGVSRKSNMVNFEVTDGSSNSSGSTGGGTTKPTVSSLSPSFGPVNTQVTINGTNFTSTGNKIKFGNEAHDNLNNMSSPDGRSLTFNVPASNDLACFHSHPACSSPTIMTSPGQYAVSVTNTNGATGALNFSVTASGSGGGGGSGGVQSSNQGANVLDALDNLIDQAGLFNQTAEINNAINSILDNLKGFWF